ncbi:hypothetical protein BABINDRAFT_168750 [Babjeviella inositovora NRRL Y-12698]|uniref:pH-response regulator protein palF/RIM8 n=1 Tax=Babjeviella inositovora NRRL Y-12698 TaxID=984486 RepID=A0A1E3QJD3_9ASCO|nr:uncharacterized protein BABINDRAFT_168750 [Babjeviella inositovora NRRL Y-12698]ODQ77789.1 hypothetical protein BABINDRAFT_168750 [Babjeviella inositovora NRRL Y-12698]
MKKAVHKLFPIAKPSKLWSNLKNEFTSTIDEFYINLDEPHHTWKPNDKISGTIILKLNKNMMDIHIALSLLGRIKLKNYPVNTSKKIDLFNHTIQIYGEDNASNGLSKGEHRFPFVVKLPGKNLYTSVDFVKGAIAYCLRASIRRTAASVSAAPSPLSDPPAQKAPTSPLLVCERSLAIINPINVAALPPQQPKTIVVNLNSSRKLMRTISSSATVHSNSSVGVLSESLSPAAPSANIGPRGKPFIKIAITTSARGYLRGEVIPITMTITHPQVKDELRLPIPHTNTGAILTLVRICRISPPTSTSAASVMSDTASTNGSVSHHSDIDPKYQINTPSPGVPSTPPTPSMSIDIEQTFRKDLTQVILPLYIDENSTQTVLRANLRVPVDAFPNISAPGVTFDYLVESCVNLAGKKLIPDREPADESRSDQQMSGVSGLSAGTPTAAAQEDSSATILNTDHLRRIKGVVRVCCSVVIGTERRERRLKAKELSQSQQQLHSASASPLADPLPLSPQSPGVRVESPLIPKATPDLAPHYSQVPPSHLHEPPGHYEQAIPMPTHEQGLSEKELLRLRAQSLMPSQPPAAPAPDLPHLVPTAPSFRFNHSGNAIGNANGLDLSQGAGTAPFEPVASGNFACAPGVLPAPSNIGISAVDDKIERERMRLRYMESNPPASLASSGMPFNDNPPNTVTSNQYFHTAISPLAPPAPSQYMMPPRAVSELGFPAANGAERSHTGANRFLSDLEGEEEFADNEEGMDYVPIYEETQSPVPSLNNPLVLQQLS